MVLPLYVLDARDPSDPFGRTHGQVRQSAMEVRVRAFKARWGNKIQMASDGRWFVYEEGRLYTLIGPDEGLLWP